MIKPERVLLERERRLEQRNRFVRALKRDQNLRFPHERLGVIGMQFAPSATSHLERYLVVGKRLFQLVDLPKQYCIRIMPQGEELMITAIDTLPHLEAFE